MPAKNFSYSVVATAPSPASSGTSISVGDGSVFPDTPFVATIWPSGAIPLVGNSEVVRVTSVSGNTLTIERGYEGTSARAVVAGDQIVSGLTAGAFTGDVGIADGVLTLATVNSNVGSFGGATSAVALTINAKGLITAASASAMPFEYPAAVSDETTALTAGVSKLTFRMPCAMTLTSVRASVGTAPTGSTLIVDINENGTSILSTKLSIDAAEKTSTTAAVPAVISDSALADDSEITIDIDQVGSTVAGAGLKIVLVGPRA